MKASTTIRILVRSNGERLPLLIEKASGQPLFEPTLYVVSRLHGRASNTIQQHLAALQVLFRFCATREIDLSARVRSNALLSPHELDGLVAAVRRSASVPSGKSLSRETAGNRLRAIRAYLNWLTKRHLHHLAHVGREFVRYQLERDRLIAELSARIPPARISVVSKAGLEPEQRIALLAAITPGSDTNPWFGDAAQKRNSIMLRLLYETGMRRGELMALRLEDINVRECRVWIVRRPDDPRDPRRRQPVVKTEERVLELGPELGRALAEYVTKTRASGTPRPKHGYLFVDSRHGAPLTASGLDKVFNALRSVPSLPTDLTSHTLRHDWNDRFSLLMEKRGVRPEEELRLRKYLQGWRWDGSAQRYNRRHIVRRANQSLRAMQQRVLSAGAEGGS